VRAGASPVGAANVRKRYLVRGQILNLMRAGATPAADANLGAPQALIAEQSTFNRPGRAQVSGGVPFSFLRPTAGPSPD
jgi:hypothetical protein